jgi:hypothetical protein
VSSLSTITMLAVPACCPRCPSGRAQLAAIGGGEILLEFLVPLPANPLCRSAKEISSCRMTRTREVELYAKERRCSILRSVSGREGYLKPLAYPASRARYRNRGGFARGAFQEGISQTSASGAVWRLLSIGNMVWTIAGRCRLAGILEPWATLGRGSGLRLAEQSRMTQFDTARTATSEALPGT